MRTIILVFTLFLSSRLQAQFAPQVGLPGSTAIHKDSTIIKAWAPGCVYANGWMDIADVSLGTVSGGQALDASGYPDGAVVSLGDMGSVTYFFENPIVDSQGYDFVVFENGFAEPGNPSMAFLEFAFVEASSDGVYWTKFPSTCLLDSTNQLPMAGVYSDASKVHNLAGKYIANYGTPFDLFDLAFSSSLHLDNIRFIRITDVVGTLQENYCARDWFGHKINDPYPTPINSGGFDLDALGIIHQKYPLGVTAPSWEEPISFYPNPTDGILTCDQANQIASIQLIDFTGKATSLLPPYNHIDLTQVSTGVYCLQVVTKNNQRNTTNIMKW